MPGTTSQADRPGVLVFPPILLLAMVGGGLLLQWLAPLGVLDQVPAPWRWIVGLCLLIPGVAAGIVANRHMRRRGTNVRPDLPSLLIVTDGIFARTRNPIYVGFFAAGLGLALILAADWIVLLAVPAALLLHVGVVRREERYLERKFGAAYLAYKASTPRYV